MSWLSAISKAVFEMSVFDELIWCVFLKAFMMVADVSSKIAVSVISLLDS